MRRWLIASGLVTVLVVAACKENRGLAPPPPPTNESRSPFFGVNGDVVFQFALQDKQALVDRQLAQIAAAPISYVRAGTGWREIEPAPPEDGEHSYDFSKTDAWVEALSSHELRWAPVLLPIPIPTWAADPDAYQVCGSRAPPARLADYAELVAGIAERYGTGGRFWKEHPELTALPVTEYEVWNAPNHSAFWCPRPDPSAFAQITVGASMAIRGVDRNARIVLGGLSPYVRGEAPATPGRMDYRAFLKVAVAAQRALADAVDAIAFHPYGPNPKKSIARVRELRRTLDKSGFKRKPIVINEIGWPRQGGRGFIISDEAERGEALRTVAEALHSARYALGIESIAPYSWTTRERDPRDPEEWFGLADPRTTEPYASGNAYRDLVEQLSSGG